MDTNHECTETQEVNATTTEYKIVGNFVQVVERIRRIIREYHPVGYGVTVKLEHEYPSGDTWKATVSRLNSCE